MTDLAMPTFPHLMIRASAGTGKTFQLSNHYLRLLLAGVPPDQILATTFTRKAAGEILDRVLTRLAEAAHADPKCQALGESLDDRGLTRTRCAELLESLVRNLHRLRISTLDAFFAQIATSFGLELGLPPGWRIIEETADQRLRGEAIQAVLAGDGSKAEERDLRLLLSLLTKGEATRSISEQVRSQVNELYGLFLETTDEAWKALLRPTRLPQAKVDAAIEALAQAALPADKRFANARAGDMAKALARDWAAFIAGGIAKKIAEGENSFASKPIGPELLDVYHSLVAHAKAVLIAELADQTEATRQLLARFDGHYQRLKRMRRGLRFEDVTRSLAGSPLAREPDRLARRLDGRIAHLLLDEFQDTSLAQWRVIASFAAQAMAGGSFFCVGDAKQAIYGWRGGAAELFDTLEAQWKQLQAQSLARSFRSSPPVIAAVNRVFGALETSPLLSYCCDAVAAWKRAFEEHSTNYNEMPGYVRMVSAPAAEEPTPQEQTTLAFAAGEIARLAREAPGRSIGALVRDNNAVARLIYELRNHDIAASEEGGNPLTDSPAVVVILSLLRIADHPGDRVARFHVASSPLGAIVDFVDHGNDAAAQRLSLEVRQSLVTRGYGGTICRWARRLADSCDERDANRLLQLVELADRYQPETTLRARDFIALVETQRIEDPSRSNVRVMTIHQAKGLEFDIVVLPQLDKKLTGQTPPVVVGRPTPTAAIDRVCRYAKDELRKLLPDAMQAAFAQYNEQQIRESLCVLYVAMTRAAHALHLIIAPSKPNEKQVPKQFSGILRACLTSGDHVPPCTTLFELGDAKWHTRVQASGETSSDTSGRRTAVAADCESRPGMSGLRKAFRIELAPLAGPRRRGLERQNPSELARGATHDLALRLQLDRTAATDRGTVFHAWFEQIEWLDDGPPDPTQLRTIAQKLGASAQNIDVWLRDFFRALQLPRLRTALSRARYTDGSSAPWSSQPAMVAELTTAASSLVVSRERDFAVRNADKLLTGTIDRLVLVRARDYRPLAAEVIDFKTDALAAQGAAGEAMLNEKYAPQLAAYRQAVSQFTGLAPERVFTTLLATEAEE